MNTIKITKINSWNNETLFHATDGKKTIPFNTTLIKDKIGNLYRVECSFKGSFETYTMANVKAKIVSYFN